MERARSRRLDAHDLDPVLEPGGDAGDQPAGPPTGHEHGVEARPARPPPIRAPPCPGRRWSLPNRRRGPRARRSRRCGRRRKTAHRRSAARRCARPRPSDGSRSTFASGEISGTKIVAACPKLARGIGHGRPVIAAPTPPRRPRRAPARRRGSRNAPRALNEPACWRNSSFGGLHPGRRGRTRAAGSRRGCGALVGRDAGNAPRGCRLR